MRAVRELDAASYQRLPQVVARAREFCGLGPAQHAGCVYVAAMGAADGPHATWGHVNPLPPETLHRLLAGGQDVARSLWDVGSLLVYVDLDYSDSDAPGRAFVHPEDALLALEPAYRGLVAAFDDFAMPMLDVVTGAGHGFLGRVALDGSAAARLRDLSREVPAWHATQAERCPPWLAARVDEAQARAYHGLGLVLEHLAHRVLARAAPADGIPIVVNNTEVGRTRDGRASASIDLTHMGDPLDCRLVRVPLGVYQKHRLRPDVVGAEAARVPPLVVLPRARRGLTEVLERRRDLARAAEQAKHGHLRIPDVERGFGRLLDDYEGSALAAWHRDYAAVRPHPPEAWPDTYARFDPETLPPCAAACLVWPNDLLLKPAHLQLLVRMLLARGWQARHIAGLVASRYALPGIWGDHWRRVDPTTRADFDVRVFAGLVAAGLDRGVDFNCVSTQEKGLCPGPGCAVDLRRERERMLARVSP